MFRLQSQAMIPWSKTTITVAATLASVLIISAIVYWPGLWFYRRLDAAAAVYNYLTVPYCVDKCDSKTPVMVVRAQFIDEAIKSAVKAQAAAAAPAESPK